MLCVWRFKKALSANRNKWMEVLCLCTVSCLYLNRHFDVSVKQFRGRTDVHETSGCVHNRKPLGERGSRRMADAGKIHLGTFRVPV